MDKDKTISAFKGVVDKLAQTGDQLAVDALEIYKLETANHQGQTGAIIKITDNGERSVDMEFIVVPTDNITLEKSTFAQHFGYRAYKTLNQMLDQGPFGYRAYKTLNQMLDQGPNGPLAKILLGTDRVIVENKEWHKLPDTRRAN